MLKEFGLEEFENYRPHALSGYAPTRSLLRTYRMRATSCFLMSLSARWTRLHECRCRTGFWTYGEAQENSAFVTHNIDEAVLLSDRVLVMSSRPGSIVKDIRIGFPRPRNRDMLLSTNSSATRGIFLPPLAECGIKEV